MRIRVFLASLVLILLTLPIQNSSAQDGAGNAVQIGAVNTANFPELEFYVSVIDPAGVPIQGLTEADFQVFADEQQVEILSVENFIEESLPISVVLAIDTSESMIGTPLADTKAAALAFLDKLGEGDEVAIVDFDTDVVVAQEFTTNLVQARTVINSLPAGGRTSLYDASYVSAELAARANTTRRFVVFLTDGNQYGQSTYPPEAGIQLARANNISFYTIGLGFGVDDEYLQAMADQTNGQYERYPDSAELTLLYEFLATYLRSSYLVRVRTNLEPDGAEHQLRVSAATTQDVVAVTTPDLYPQLVLNGVPTEPVTLPFELTYQVSAVRGLGGVTVTIDGQPVAVTLDPSADPNVQIGRATIDPYTLEPTVEHILLIEAQDVAGGVRSISVPVTATDLPPVFVIGGLGEAENVTLPSINMVAEILQAQQPVSAIIYRVDGVEVGQANEAPYAVSIDTLALGPGPHSLEVAVVDPSGETTQVLNFSVDAALFITPTATPTNTPTPSDTPTPTLTNTPTFTSTSTPTDTPSATLTNTPTPSNTPTPTLTNTPTFTSTPTPTDTPTLTNTPTSTDTPTPSDTPTITLTPTVLAMATATPRPATNTPRPSSTPLPTNTPEPTETATATSSSTPVPPTDTPSPTASATDRPTATSTATATPTDTPTIEVVAVEPSATATPIPTDTPEPSSTPTDTPTFTPEPSSTPTDTPTFTPEPSSTPTLTRTATLVPTVEPQEVSVEEDEGGDGAITRYWPIIVGLILVALILLFAFFTRRRREEAPPR